MTDATRHPVSPRGLLFVALALSAVVGLAACGGSGSTSGATTTGSTTKRAATTAATTTPGAGRSSVVRVADSDLGRIVVNGDGMTLYVFTPDTSTSIACTGGCAQAWPPLTATADPSGTDVTGTLTLVTRDDGTRQVALAGRPLYAYAGDTASGDTNGQGSGGKWFVVSADGSPIKRSAGSGSATTTAGKSRY